ncbi:hypothetical protein BV375_31400 [Nostoc sp. 106C]|nr:hypothetical protein BV375_31400 [Nostoc sp. 106C]
MQPTQDFAETHNPAVSSLQTQIAGVQFLKNVLGNNTAVLIDLKEHIYLFSDLCNKATVFCAFSPSTN